MPNRFLSYLNKASFPHFSCFNTSEYRLKQDKKRYIKKLGFVCLLLLNLISFHSAENLIKIHQKLHVKSLF